MDCIVADNTKFLDKNEKLQKSSNENKIGQQNKTKKNNSELVKTYLSVYNIVNAIGWIYLMFEVLWRLIYIQDSLSIAVVWKNNNLLIFTLLLLVFLDIAHIYLGFVTPNAKVNVILLMHCKVFRRFHLWLALFLFPESQQHPSVAWMLLSWAVLDIIRFPFYALNIWKLSPKFLYNLRYQSEILMYPIGLMCEFAVWVALLSNIWQYDTLACRFYYAFVISYLLWRFYSFPKNFSRMLSNVKQTN